MFILRTILIAAAFKAACAFGQSGQLDLSFGVNGIATLVVDTLVLSGNDMAVQYDGKILTTGRCSNGQGWDVYVIRCLSDGNLDPDFGDGGFVRTDLGTFWDQAFAIGFDDEGRIIVAAESFSNPLSSIVTVLRYHSDGSLDESFGTGGLAHAPVTAYGHPRDVMVKGNDAIIVVGCNTAYSAIALYQFTDAGEPDNSFGSGGVVTVSPFWDLNMATGVLVQDDSKVTVSCVYGPPGAYDVGLIRFMPNGSFDTSFGNNGIATLSVSPGDETANGLGLQSDGRIVIAGSSDNPLNYGMYAARFTAAGILDTSFGSNGFVTLSDRANDLVIQNNDAILLAGRSDQVGGNSRVAIVRLTPSGQLDPAFGAGGVVLTQVPGVSYAAGYRVGLQPDGRVIASAGGGGHPMLLRYLAGPQIGIEESTGFDHGVKMYPVPASDIVNIEFNSDPAENMALQVTDATGRTVISQVYHRSSRVANSGRVQLDLGQLVPGSYSVILSDGFGVRTLKLIKV